MATTGTWRVEVIADNSGKWVGNGLTFETREAAEDYGNDLYRRWTLVREWRAVPVDHPFGEREVTG
jgi:hypothetical protein